MKRMILFSLLICLTISIFSLHVTRIGQLSYPTDLLKYLPSFVEEARCVKVIDGKTIEVEFSFPVGRREKVSLIGIDVSNTSSYDSNDLPLAITKQFLEGKKIYLSYDWEGKNEHGDLLAYAWIPVSTEVGGFYLCWNVTMLLNGYAEPSGENFDSKMKIMFYEASLFAYENKTGLLKAAVSGEPSAEKIEEMEYLVRKRLYDLLWKTAAPVTRTASALGATATATPTQSIDGLSELMQGMTWGMTVPEVKANVKQMVKTDESLGTSSGEIKYEGTYYDASWEVTFGFSGKVDQAGVSVLRLNRIYYLFVVKDKTISNIAPLRLAKNEELKTYFTLLFGEPTINTYRVRADTFKTTDTIIILGYVNWLGQIDGAGSYESSIFLEPLTDN
ncbi:MAG TPA: hypothetical protein PLO55_12460 [Thermotogota bacterium]|nr:hypothetical protein [Thermotogota bacterium]